MCRLLIVWIVMLGYISWIVFLMLVLLDRIWLLRILWGCLMLVVCRYLQRIWSNRVTFLIWHSLIMLLWCMVVTILHWCLAIWSRELIILCFIFLLWMIQDCQAEHLEYNIWMWRHWLMLIIIWIKLGDWLALLCLSLYGCHDYCYRMIWFLF